MKQICLLAICIMVDVLPVELVHTVEKDVDNRISDLTRFLASI